MSGEAIFTLPADETVVNLPEPEVVEGVYVYNGEHAQQAVDHLIQWFRRPRNSEYLRVVCGQGQAIEDVLWQLNTAFDVDNALGDQLNLLGKIVGELRGGRDDEDFRAAVRTRILVNSSNGRIEDLIAIILSLTPDATSIRITELWPAKLRIEVYDDFAGASPPTVARLLRQAKPAGVGLLFVPVDIGETMIWRSPAGPDTVNGWGAKWARAL